MEDLVHFSIGKLVTLKILRLRREIIFGVVETKLKLWTDCTGSAILTTEKLNCDPERTETKSECS